MTSNVFSFAPLEDLSKPTAVRAERYVVGVDLGQSHDPTAISCVRRIDADDGDPSRSIFQVGHLERLPLGTPYPRLVRYAVGMLGSPRLRGKSELVIDYTGVGKPIFDMFEGHGVSPIGVTITAGDAVACEGTTVFRVPKLHLISRLQALLHEGRLKIHKGLPDAPALVAELQDFRVEIMDSGYWRFNARSGRHDDLVLAVAIAVWRAHGDNAVGSSSIIEYYRRLAEGTLSFTGRRASAPAPDVVLRAPSGTGATTVHAISGRQYTLAANGCVTLPRKDAAALIQSGWRLVEDPQDAFVAS